VGVFGERTREVFWLGVGPWKHGERGGGGQGARGGGAVFSWGG